MNLNELFKNFKSEDGNIYVKPNIPPNKAKNAIASYASDILPKDIIVLVDETITGSGKSGILITEKTIYTKEDFTSPIIYDFDYVPSISSKKTLMGTDIYIGRNKTINLGTTSKSDSNKLVMLLSEYISQYRTTQKDTNIQTLQIDDSDNENKSDNSQSEKEKSNFSKVFALAKNVGSIAASSIESKSLEIKKIKEKLNELQDDELIRIVNSDSFFSRSSQEKSIAFNILKSRGYSSEIIRGR